MTYRLGAGNSTRMPGSATATMAALAVLIGVAAIAPAVAQQPDAAAAHKAKCDPLVADARAKSSLEKAAIDRALDAGKRYNAIAGQYDRTRDTYVKFRDSGNHLRAWQMVSTLDALWARLKPLNEELIAARSARLGGLRQSCAAISRGIAAGCLQSSNCGTLLEKHTASLGNAISRRTRQAGTWKTAADEKLNPANAQKGCPIAKAIAPRATVMAVGGRVWIVRGVRSIPAAVGGTLHPGDLLVVEAGSNASLDLFGSGIMKISEKTKFEIPNPVTAPPPPGIATQAWAKAKQLIQGESFELKQCLDSGRRG